MTLSAHTLLPPTGSRHQPLMRICRRDMSRQSPGWTRIDLPGLRHGQRLQPRWVGAW